MKVKNLILALTNLNPDLEIWVETNHTSTKASIIIANDELIVIGDKYTHREEEYNFRKYNFETGKLDKWISKYK